MKTRIEHDLLGAKEVPAQAYWGVHTARAVENFPITGTTIGRYEHLICALAVVKQAAARTNADLGLLSDERAAAIDQACNEIRAGQWADQFIVDVIQGGAGTSTNMNANEVIGNRALQIMGHDIGQYQYLHPADHVNMSQSTNDVYPTALNIATITSCDSLDAAMAQLISAFDDKATEFDRVIKMGRTQLQDAVPMTLGQEMRGYAVTIGEDRQRLAESTALLHEINMGATAIGTRLNAPPGYVDAVCKHLRALTGRPLVTAENLIEATQDPGAFVHVSGVLRRIAVKLSKICNDLRLLASGPRAGLHEINLPAVQAGSSIMPGKVNPVIPEVVTQVCYSVIGNDLTITMAAEAGQLQLNAFEPIIARSLFDSIAQLTAACRTLTTRCVQGITANVATMAAHVHHSIGLATALNPYLGYAKTTDVAREALDSHRSVADIVLERGYLGEQQLRQILAPERLANLSIDSQAVVSSHDA
ncbi:aspartate ammonia-lyase [Mycolicibacterium mucogenicum]|uniref:aspartate ammonia-lyase n=1 Tax=Mycolicibacterium mucogenicum TaxID=56689 RepID=UPI00226AA18C|nr:aspartate ammonia-lyase [Mycolicibacterium mucogenicum]MCX8562845.1 aspartate ammonia-lyase [Mycolicibacterium mucogenicum]